MTPEEEAAKKRAEERAQRLAKAVATLEDSERELREDAEDRVILAAELLVKYKAEIGKRGLDFEILDCGAQGIVAIKRVDAITMAKWDETSESFVKKGQPIPSGAWLNFTTPAILHPDAKVYRQMCVDTEQRPGASSLPIMIAGALKVLHGAFAKEVSTK